MNDGLEAALTEYPVNVACCCFELSIIHGFQLVWPGFQVPVGTDRPQTLWCHTQEESVKVSKPAQASLYLPVCNARPKKNKIYFLTTINYVCFTIWHVFIMTLKIYLSRLIKALI